MKMEVKPVTVTIGAEVTGVDLHRPLDDEQRQAIHDAFTRHLVLFFRNQELTPDQQLAFAGNFGPPMVARPRGEMTDGSESPASPDEPSPFVTLEDTPESPPKADHWHTDVPFVREPPDIAVLCMLASPPVGGDTLWVNLHAVFDSLSPTMQAVLSTLDLVVGVGTPVKAGYTGKDGGEEEFQRLLREVPPSRHPLVRIHPVSGRPALWWSGKEFARGIAGMHPAESDALLGFLQSRLDDPNHQCRWRWRAHDVVMWDERCTNHRAVSDHYPSFRSIRRCLVGHAAPVPVGGRTIPAGVS
jgi:taurine dioxygenase